MDKDWLLHLSVEQWAQVEAAFPQRRGRSGFERKLSNRQAFEAVLYRAWVACPWRDLPSEYGGHHAVYMRWKRWVNSGVPQRPLVNSHLEATERGELNMNLTMIDSTVVRAQQHAPGARKKRRRPGARPLARRPGHENPYHQCERAPDAESVLERR